MSGYRVRLSSLVNVAVQIQTSGQCTPDWVLEHIDTPAIRSMLRAVGFDYAFSTCEHMRHWLFDDLPFNREIKTRYPSAEAGLQKFLLSVSAGRFYHPIINAWYNTKGVMMS